MLLNLIKDEQNSSQINLETAKLISTRIKRLYPNITIYIIGSVLKPRTVHPGSDIDLITKGLNEEEHSFLIRNIFTEFPSLKIDIRRMEDLDEYLTQKLLTESLQV